MENAGRQYDADMKYSVDRKYIADKKYNVDFVRISSTFNDKVYCDWSSAFNEIETIWMISWNCEIFLLMLSTVKAICLIHCN